MGNVLKILGAVGAAVGVGAIAAATALNPNLKLKELDDEWERYCDEYEKKAAPLRKRVNGGDRKAYDKLAELQEVFEEKEQEYQRKRAVLFAKTKEGKKENKKAADKKLDSEQREKEHKYEMEKLEAKHRMEMEKMAYEKGNSVMGTAAMQIIGNNGEEVVCPHCGNQNNSGAKFCCVCGQALNIKRFCVNCGAQIDTNAKFCENCGSKVIEVSQQIQFTQQADVSKQRKQFFDGEIHKCPSCGEVLNSFSSNCPTCGYELRGVRTANSIQDFAEKIENCPSEKRMIELIRNFPIPNTKEDILEFMILASSNFDVKYYQKHLDEEDASDAWLAKIEQCYKKAKTTFNQQDLQKIEEIYNEVKDKINPSRKFFRTMGNW